MNEKFLYFDNLKFTRDDKTGYYLNSTIRKRMHIYVWEFYNGNIPTGYEVHHVDFDKSNNDISNLRLLTTDEHRKLHGILLTDEQREWRRNNLTENARPKASEWHKSEEGREWHRLQYEKTKEVLHKKCERLCVNCGKTFMGHSTSKFCSNNCKSAYRRKEGKDITCERNCVICGTPFKTNKYDPARCCSRRCGAILAYRNRGKNES